MAVRLNHTIVFANDKVSSARFLTGLFGLPEPIHAGPFAIVQLEGGLSLDYMDLEGKIALQHLAFLVSEAEFDDIFGRICALGLTYWADPARSQPG